MQATQANIEALLQMQEIDRNRARAELEMKNLPHKDLVLQGRTKRKALQAAHDNATGVLAQEKQALAQIDAEDEKLVAKTQDAQTAIEEASGDYRRVSQLTRDMEGAQKRRETLAFQREKVKARVDEAAKLVAAAVQAMDAIDQREAQLVEEYNQKTASLANDVQAGMQLRNDLAATLPEEILTAYNEAVSRCKGVGLAQLNGTACSACRHELDADRLLHARLEAPLASCPSCKRLLIVPEGE